MQRDLMSRFLLKRDGVFTDKTLHGPQFRIKDNDDEKDYSVEAVISSSRVDADNDRILPRALEDWVKNNAGEPILMFREHKREVLLGEWNEFELRDMEDYKGEVELVAKGVMYEEMSAVQDARAAMKRKRLNATSVGMRIGDVRYGNGSFEIGIVDIKEASLVVWGANYDAVMLGSAPLYGKERGFDMDGFRGMLRHSGFGEADQQKMLDYAKALAGGANVASKTDDEMLFLQLLAA